MNDQSRDFWPNGLSSRLQARAEKRRKDRHWTLKARAPRRLPTLFDLAAAMSPQAAEVVRLLSIQNEIAEDLCWMDPDAPADLRWY